MGAGIYLRYELLRAGRNPRFVLFSLAFPLALFLLITAPNKDQQLSGVSFLLYYMSGMVAWASMAAVVGGGARIAVDRSIGWNRQLRVSPLPVNTYVWAKVIAGYLTALVSMVVLYVAGGALGVRLSPGHWLG